MDNDKLRREHEYLMTASRTLEETIKKQSLSEESLKDNDAKVKYYTGLPTFNTLMAIFTFVSASLEDNSRTILSRFQQFLSALACAMYRVIVRACAYCHSKWRPSNGCHVYITRSDVSA